MMKIENPDGATPLTEEDLEGLIPSHITMRSELDRFEQDNINEALAWVENRKPKNIFSESFMKTLSKTGIDRATYIESLQAADSYGCDYKPLLEFVRS